LLYTSSRRRPGWPDIITYSLLGSIITLSAISYAPLAVIIYLLGLWTVVRLLRSNRPISMRKGLATLAVSAVVVALPYVLFGLYLLVTRTFNEFKSQAFSFNTNFYSQYSPDSPISLLDSAFSIVQGVGRSYYDVFTMQ